VRGWERKRSSGTDPLSKKKEKVEASPILQVEKQACRLLNQGSGLNLRRAEG